MKRFILLLLVLGSCAAQGAEVKCFSCKKEELGNCVTEVTCAAAEKCFSDTAAADGAEAKGCLAEAECAVDPSTKTCCDGDLCNKDPLAPTNGGGALLPSPGLGLVLASFTTLLIIFIMA